MFTRQKYLLLALVALIGVAGAGLLFWVVSGHRTAELAAASPKQCLVDKDTRAGRFAGMVRVPAGTFDMGDDVYPEEGPLKARQVNAFWMDAHEVTNDEFAAFVKATGYVTVAERDVDAKVHPELPPEMRRAGAVVFVMPNDVDGSGDITQWWQYIAGANWRHPGGPQTNIEGYGHFPVVALALADVQAYAKWKGRELPTEAQWEWAARGGAKGKLAHEQPKEANSWQGIFPVLNTGDDGFIGLAPVGCFKANGYGLYDMIGNVWEWTRDIYDGDPKRGVIKGGSYLCAPNYCMRYRAGARQAQELDLAASHLGFRTIVNE
ncbi:MAG: formylglycine-generating enzyme family protein [Parvibaculaceae bacterium]